MIKEFSLYIHIPFCKSKCNYCSFTSFSNCGDKMIEYIEAVKRELLFHKEHTLNQNENIKSEQLNNTKMQQQNSKYNPKMTTENNENNLEKQDKEQEPQQMSFLKSQNIVNQNKKVKTQANLMSQPNRTLIIRNCTKNNNSFDRAIITSNNLKISSQILGDDFQKRTTLLNKKLEESLQNIQNKKTLNKSISINQTNNKCKNIIKTIYIGGGTPSILPINAIPELLTFIKQNFTLDDKCEITVEANPDSFTLTKAIAWHSEGANRVSFGLQSDDDTVLKKLGRVHNFQQFITAVDNAKKAGFTNINADILLGLPDQTVESAIQTINNISKMGLTHISAYGLIVEEGTPFAEQVKNGEVILPSDEQAVAIYNAVCEELQKVGFERYEISNFAKVRDISDCDSSNNKNLNEMKSNLISNRVNLLNIKKFNKNYLQNQCQHNLNYWARGEFLGVGLGAYSFMNGEHWGNGVDLTEYVTQPYDRQNIEPETQKTAMEESIMLALRCEKGLDIVKFNKTFGVDFEQLYEKPLKKSLENNLVKIENNHLKIIDFEISNSIILNFF